MFDPSDTPRVFALPPGVDFPKALLDGLITRTGDAAPDALARVLLIVNTRRMERRIRDLFDTGPPRLLPRVSLVTDIGENWQVDAIPPAISPLRRRLELARLISVLLERQPDLAARSSLYDLADSLAGLIDEMQGEGVSTDDIRNLDVTDMSGHWARAQAFIGIADQYLDAGDGRMDAQARQRRVVEALIAHWKADPPKHPVILAGSTGSRGTTLMLMQAVAQLPQGAVVLPGFDFDQPAPVWDAMDRPEQSEDHPQFRFVNVAHAMGINPTDIREWTDVKPPSPARNRLTSLSLRSAPFTDSWLDEGPQLRDLDTATQNMTLIEAPSPRSEALAIALRLRKAAETGQTAALITPDRMLTRRVSAALDQWNILPDDSAGLPLQLSPPGRFLRHICQLFVHPLTGDQLMTLLKHPLCHSGTDRGDHLLHTRDLELHLRRNGPPFPGADSFAAFQTAARNPPPDTWITWLTGVFADKTVAGSQPLTTWVEQLRDLAEGIAAGADTPGSGGLWEKNAGQKALQVMTALDSESAHGGDMTAHEFNDLLGALLAGEEVRDRDAPFGKIMIWGTLEARVQGADLLILGGLNEDSWPEATRPDPWLNRRMRLQAGLLLPERRIGLSAHDFQQAVAAPEVWLTRSVRSDDAETVASRWLNRLTNLMSGLPDQGGPQALAGMRARGQTWLNWAKAAEAVDDVAPAEWPSPRPPVAARPRQLSVTEIKRLIRDPYAIYAKHVLRLRPLDPLMREPDALLRGIVVHEILEQFIKDTLADAQTLNAASFLEQCETLLTDMVPWPTAQRFWLARMGRVAQDFITSEKQRRARSKPISFEAEANLRLDPLDFTIIGRADRIDRDEAGQLLIYDYKTGKPPSNAEQTHFDKQLLIEAAIAEEGGFKGVDANTVAQAVFIGLGTTFQEIAAPLDKEPTQKVLSGLRDLIGKYLDPTQGFTARLKLQKDTDTGDYDHLARFGEWDRTASPKGEDLE
ncbi:double-strand break repair protein AddB [Arenibacterium sp. CAU 1754]